MIDTKEMKNAPDGSHTLAPPFEVAPAHFVPMIERDAPVLSPFLRELVIFEVRLGRRTTAPIEHKFIGPRKNIGAVIANAKWGITHKSDPALFGIRFNLTPLLMRDPLHITEET